jgi:hypothetical protein
MPHMDKGCHELIHGWQAGHCECMDEYNHVRKWVFDCEVNQPSDTVNKVREPFTCAKVCLSNVSHPPFQPNGSCVCCGRLSSCRGDHAPGMQNLSRKSRSHKLSRLEQNKLDQAKEEERRKAQAEEEARKKAEVAANEARQIKEAQRLEEEERAAQEKKLQAEADEKALARTYGQARASPTARARKVASAGRMTKSAPAGG